jgi:hypothetical protein
MMLSKIQSFFKTKNKYLNLIPEVHQTLYNDRKSHKVNLGQIQARLNSQLPEVKDLTQVEFQVFSQWGDDGIIQYLVDKIDIPNKVFIEFGVENYRESNTRFLLINNAYSGLVIDGNKESVDFIKNDELSWSYDLHAVHSFITKDNINKLIQDFLNKGYHREIAILSVDIDGNDYWIWDEINVVDPIIVIAEYNAVYGATNKWTIPYKADFQGVSEHKSRYYWGASLNAFCHLANKKGYSFIGCNSNGNNAYFVRNDKSGAFKAKTSGEGFIDASFRLYADEAGEKHGGSKSISLLKGMQIFDIDKGGLVTI